MGDEFNNDWITLFASDTPCPAGQRLGVSYMRAQQESVSVNLDGAIFPLRQSVSGLSAISGVVWDAGLYLVDFLLSQRRRSGNSDGIFQSNVLDLGCGTGIAGVVSFLLGAERVLLSDCVYSEYLQANMEYAMNMSDTQPNLEKSNEEFIRQRIIKFQSYDWSEETIPDTLLYPQSAQSLNKQQQQQQQSSQLLSSEPNAYVEPGNEKNDPHSELQGKETTKTKSCNCWDSIVCSDVLYDEKAHAPLLHCLRNIRFRRLLLSYKRRHDDPERRFFQELAQFCHIEVVPHDQIVPINVPMTSRVGLYIIIATPKY